ncbi:response regulator [Chamaesiphon sp. VAR_48_metabat_135_sub]|uniref:response regulator n=1 Tax=Chamaesiphon sp. VAR_48_metabat_135_sub TaxID=2964699 RepID=UPI00286AE9F4|nr:response regulator [Chamaesiphon sp. VAR_48_metabat_135_sub]
MNSLDSYDYIQKTDSTLTVDGFEPSIAEISRLDQAILDAQASNSLEAEAIAHECAAQFYLEWGKEKIAVVYLQDAYDCYARSGAKFKTESLEQQYPQFLASILRQRQQQLGGSNYFTDEFIATLSHEFRNPLNSILGMSEILLEEVFGSMNEKQLNAVTTIDRSGWYLFALINNMVDLSKIQVGKLELEITNVSVAELCDSSITFVKHCAIQKQIQLDLDIPDLVGDIAVDLQRIHQVLINLLTQAIDSTPVGGMVKLVVRKARASSGVNATSVIQFSAIDTSKDISSSCNHKATQSFLPINSRRIGLGLMLVKPIVELHGGTLEFQSTIGRGGCTIVSLPDRYFSLDSISSAEDFSSRSGTIVEEIPKQPLILIVEDNELNINTISSYLTAKGYRPIVAQDGQSAIEMTNLHHPDLILMDIQMPGMDGLEAIVQIRQNPQLAEIPIIALTALAMEGDREKCLAAGANEYIPKPVKLKQLNTTIQQFLTASLVEISERK